MAYTIPAIHTYNTCYIHTHTHRSCRSLLYIHTYTHTHIHTDDVTWRTDMAYTL
jgi:hypothetical protein